MQFFDYFAAVGSDVLNGRDERSRPTQLLYNMVQRLSEKHCELNRKGMGKADANEILEENVSNRASYCWF